VLDTLSGEAGEREATRQRLVYGVPELRARLYEQYVSTMTVLARAIAARLGRAEDDEEIRLWSGAVIGTMIAAFERGDEALIVQHDFAARIDRALAFLEAHLTL